MKYLLATLLIFASLPAYAICGPRGEVLKYFFERYDETERYRGLDEKGRMIKILVSPNNDTWTMIGIEPEGKTCVLYSGFIWGEAPTEVEGN